MKQMKRIVQGLMIGALVLSLFGFLSVGSLQAQNSEEQAPELTKEQLQQLEDLYSSPASDLGTPGINIDGDGSGGYEYPDGASSFADSSATSMITSLLGAGGGTESLVVMSLLYAFGEYWWIPIVFYFLLLLLVAFVLYASVFKKFKRFSREQAMVFGWNETKKHIWFFVLISLIQVIIYAVLFILLSMFFTISPYLPIPILKDTIPYAGYYVSALGIVIIFFFLLFVAGTTKISLKFTDGVRASIADLFTAVTYLPKFILSALLYALIIVGPYILLGTAAYYLRDTLNSLQLGIGTTVLGLLLAIPICYWIPKFYLYYMVVMDKGVWPIKAFQLASQYSKGAKTDLSLFLVLFLAITTVGSNTPLMLGLFMAAPLTSLAFAHAYRQLGKGESAE